MKIAEIMLRCCNTKIEIVLDEAGISAGLPDEVRKNVECPTCQKLAILSFEAIGDQIENVHQEII
ncbi:MAG: hypothetical protein AABZ31_05305 [Bdellovibrionota bacterium]